VLVQRTRVRGIVSGLLEKGAILKYVKRADDVQVGDRVVTSGLDGIFPKGVSVGEVTRVSRKDRGLFLYAEVTPTADASRLEEVLVTAASGAELLDTHPAGTPKLVAPPALPLDFIGPPDPATLGIIGPPPPTTSRGAHAGATLGNAARSAATSVRKQAPPPVVEEDEER